MAEPNFKPAILRLTLSFVLALIFANLLRFFDQKDLNVNKKRATHSRPTSRLGWVAVCLSILAVIATNYDAWTFNIAISALPIFLAGLIFILLMKLRQTDPANYVRQRVVNWKLLASSIANWGRDY